MVSFLGRVSAQGTFSSGGGHRSSDLSPAGGCGWRSPPCASSCPLLPPSPSRLHLCAVLILIGVGLEVAPSPGECPLLPPQSALTPLLCPGFLGKPSPIPASLPSRWETAPFTAEGETSPGSDTHTPSAPLPDPVPPLLWQVSPAPSSSCLAFSCWSREVRAGAGWELGGAEPGVGGAELSH